MVKCFIGIGKLSNFYIYILGCIFFNVAQFLIINYYESALQKRQLIQSIFKHLGYIFFGFIFLILLKYNNRYSKKIHRSKKSKDYDNNDNKNTQLIYNNNIKNIVLSVNDKITLILVGVNYIVYYESLKIINYLGFYSLEIWTVEIIFLLLLTHYYFPNTLYKHQIFSMIIIIIINTGLLIYASICKVYINKKEEKENIYNKKGILTCFSIIMIYISIAFLISFSRVKVKKIMDNQFLSPYKIIIIIGIFGFFLDFILSLFFIIKGNFEICENDEDKIDIYCYGEILIYFSEIGNNILIEIIIAFTYIIFCFFNLVCELLIIKYLSQNHILMSDNIYYEILKLISYFFDNNEKERELKKESFIILQVVEIIKFIGCLIYLEIIELRFCGLNKNLKKAIMLRSRTESCIKSRGDTVYSIQQQLNLDEDNNSDRDSINNNEIEIKNI